MAGDDVTKSRITVRGQLQLGRELHLVRELPSAAPPKRTFQVRGPERVPQARISPSSHPSRTGVATQKFEFALEPGAEEVHIEDNGLCQAYGIFGVPGVGKTYLLMHLLRQLLSHKQDDPAHKFGALILDPKAALLQDVVELVRNIGREDDLFIVNEEHMRAHSTEMNVIASYLDADNLGKALAMSAQSAGIGSKEPYWMNELGNVLGAALQVLALMAKAYNKEPTLSDLVEMLLGHIDDGSESTAILGLELAEAEKFQSQWSEDDQRRFAISRDRLQRFRRSKDYDIMSSFIDQSYGLFRNPTFRAFSPEVPFAAGQNMYDAICDEGRILLVSVSKRNLAISKILCTLIKTLFQQTVLTRLDRYRSRELTNFSRPLLFVADEYSDVATEVSGQPMGDALFFSQMRQFGCMGLVATQSVHMLEHSGLGKTWKAIFANLAAKIFMRLGDSETAEEASRLVGDGEFRFQAFDRSYNKDGSTQSIRFDLKDKKDLPTRVLLQDLAQGQAVVVGSLDGKSRPAVRFIHVASTTDEG